MFEEKQELIEITEIWMPVFKNGEAYNFNQGKNLKRVALLANGKVILLDKGFLADKSYISERSYKEKFFPKCKTSPHCSHNTSGRDMDKPCSIEFKIN